jgi:hypothetical protein
MFGTCPVLVPAGMAYGQDGFGVVVLDGLSIGNNLLVCILKPKCSLETASSSVCDDGSIDLVKIVITVKD